MLGKLIKYEIKATAKFYILIYGLVLFFALLARIFFSVEAFANSNSGVGQTIQVMAFVMFASLYLMMVIAMYVATTIIVVTRFYRNLFTGEGYLMFTLPVKPWQHLVTKMAVPAIWLVGNFLVMFLSIAIMLSHKVVWDNFQIGWEMLTVVMRESGINFTPFVLEFIVIMVLGLIAYGLPMYACICVGQLFGKHRILGAFLAYLGLNVISQVIGQVVSSLIRVNAESMGRAVEHADSVAEMLPFLHGTFIVSIGLSLMFSTVYFLVCNHIMEKKLNLE